MKCYICGKLGPSKFSLAGEQWDWFTGYLPETVHFCPEHKNSRKRNELFQQASTKEGGTRF